MKMASFGFATTSALLLGGALIHGCGPNSDPPAEATGGVSTGGILTGTGGAPTTGGGTASGATGGTIPGTGGGSTEDCPPIPDTVLLTNFSEAAFTVGQTWASGQEDWGDSNTTLTGTTFHYSGPEGAPMLVATIWDATFDPTITSPPALNLQATIPVDGYAGFGLAFGPKCNDASRLTGLRFTLTGDMGNAGLQVQIQQKSNYPADAEGRGVCPFTSETTKWDECTNNRFDVEAPAGLVDVPFANFAGGMPQPFNPAELVGMQFQFGCGTEGECPVNVVLDDITFY